MPTQYVIRWFYLQGLVCLCVSDAETIEKHTKEKGKHKTTTEMILEVSQ